MPKDEADPSDPMELCGVPGPDGDDREMVLAVIDEYVRMGFCAEQILTLFSDPDYVMTHRIWREKGPDYVRECLDQVARRWGADPCVIAPA